MNSAELGEEQSQLTGRHALQRHLSFLILLLEQIWHCLTDLPQSHCQKSKVSGDGGAIPRASGCGLIATQVWGLGKHWSWPATPPVLSLGHLGQSSAHIWLLFWRLHTIYLAPHPLSPPLTALLRAHGWPASTCSEYAGDFNWTRALFCLSLLPRLPGQERPHRSGRQNNSKHSLAVLTSVCSDNFLTPEPLLFL